MELHNHDVLTACKLVYNATHIPIFLIKKDQEISWTYNSIHSSVIGKKKLPKTVVNHLFSIKNNSNIQLAYINNQNGQIAILPNPGKNEDSLLILFPNADKFFSANPLNEQQENSEKGTNELISAAILLHYIFYKEHLSLHEVTKTNQNVPTTQIADVIELQIIEQRENSNFHSSYLAEKKIFQHVQQGNKEKVLQYLKLHSEEGIYGTLSKNDLLRHKKNLIITAITLSTRAAIEGGLYPEIAYNLSDAYIQHIEEVKKIDSMNQIIENILVDFTERVEKTNRSQFSKIILLCQEYIFNHLYNDLTLETIAKQLHISPSYLSNKFKEETGETLKTFIQQKRIEEAKNLIIFSNFSLSEIYTLLNFHDQSYFIKVFKKYTGLTPRQFQNNYIIKQNEPKFGG